MTKKNERTVHVTADEAAERRNKGQTETDWRRIDALTNDEIIASIDPNDKGDVDWNSMTVDIPRAKVAFTMRYDPEYP